MKKLLFFSTLAAISFTSSAQNEKYIASKPQRDVAETSAGVSFIKHERKTPFKKNPNALVVNDIPTGGHSNNAYGGFTRPGRSVIDYNDSLNTLTLIHRSCPACGDGSPNSGCLNFDYSKNGGNTWTGNKGVIFCSNGFFAGALSFCSNS
ncbi:MAG: hypothetical protein HY063_07920 [Bacteroidetes bacterium]|nr:hypothetical protein [Bacteroidota bacterium]